MHWLSNHPRYGNLFFDSIGGLQNINSTKILYSVDARDGTEAILVTKVKEWFLNRYQQELFGAGYVREHILQTAKRRLEEIPHEELSHASKKNRIDLMVRIAFARQILEGTHSSSPHSSPSSSIHTSDTEFNEENLTRVTEVASEHASTLRGLTRTARTQFKTKNERDTTGPS